MSEQSEPSAPDRAGRRNLTALFVVSVLIGLSVAVYEVALPLYLKRAGMGWTAMGWIYGVAAIVTFGVRVCLGAWSDRVGRKIIYVGSLFATGIATAATPFFAMAWVQAALKSVTDPTTRVREAMHSVLLYECWPKRFQRIFSKTRGVEFMFHFVGLLLAAWLLVRLARWDVSAPEGWFILGAAGLLAAAGVIFALGFRERPMDHQGKPAVTWRNLIRMKLTRPMWVLTISIFIFNFGITISHCFALQLFFQEKYGASDADVFTIGALHRLSSALTLILLGHVFRTRLRFWLMLFLVSEGIFLAAPCFMPAGTYSVGGLALPALWVAVAVWLGHDFLGMGLWLPIQQTLLQRYSRPDARGEDMSLSTALGALGGVAAPFVAGWLRTFPGLRPEVSINLPFLVSGIGVAVSAVALLWLPREAGETAPAWWMRLRAWAGIPGAATTDEESAPRAE